MKLHHKIHTWTASVVLLTALFVGVTACNNSDADVASHNVSKAADQFEVYRRVVFFNGITDTYLLYIEGYCSLGNDDDIDELSVTCKTGPKAYKKYFLGLSDNVSYFVDQPEPINVSAYHYRVIFKPEAIIPDFDRP